MSYTKLVKQWSREYKAKLKQEQKQRKIQKENELKFQDALYTAMIKEDIRKQAEEENRIKRIKEIKDNILLSLQKCNPFQYNQYLIIWDILTGNYIQIENDLYKGKINKNDITAIVNYIKGFSNEIISEYWENKLMEVSVI